MLNNLTGKGDLVCIQEILNVTRSEIALYSDLLISFRVNCYYGGNPQAPFGGYKMSGSGREW